MTTRSRQELITVAQTAALLRITDRYVRKLISEGHIPKADRNMVPLVGAVHGYIDLLKDEERRASKTAAASEMQRAKTREIELRIAREEGKLIEAAAAESVFADVLGAWRNELSGLGAAVTRDLSLRQRIDDYIESAVARARARFAEKRKALKDGTK